MSARASTAFTNGEIADCLDRVADLLEAQDANRYRVRAYRAAVDTIRKHPRSMSEVLAEGGVEALEALPTIGRGIAGHVAEMVGRGGLTLLDRLEGEVSPEALLSTVPGIGPELAARIHHELAVDTLEELEVAAHDGRLAQVQGFGRRRVRAVQDELAVLLGRSARHRARRRAWLDAGRTPPDGAGPTPRPDVATLLAVDTEYLEGAAEGRLRKIAPRRFNPEHEAWLPVLHVERDGWDMTALFSNTARAHELDRTRDWVVIYYRHDGDEGQCTVVTETRGHDAGRRVVRGREAECAAHHAAQSGRSPR